MTCWPGLFGRPDLFEAAKTGQAERVRLALQRGADANAWDPQLGATPLHHAALHGHVGCIRALLLHAKPDVRSKDKVGDTPLHYAALMGFASCCSVLIKAGADVGDRNYDGDTPLLMAGRGVGVAAASAESVRLMLTAASPRTRKLRNLRSLNLADSTVAGDGGSGDSRSPRPRYQPGSTCESDVVPTDWALDCLKLQYGDKVAGGSFGDVYKGCVLLHPKLLAAKTAKRGSACSAGLTWPPRATGRILARLWPSKRSGCTATSARSA